MTHRLPTDGKTPAQYPESSWAIPLTAAIFRRRWDRCGKPSTTRGGHPGRITPDSRRPGRPGAPYRCRAARSSGRPRRRWTLPTAGTLCSWTQPTGRDAEGGTRSLPPRTPRATSSPAKRKLTGRMAQVRSRAISGSTDSAQADHLFSSTRRHGRDVEHPPTRRGYQRSSAPTEPVRYETGSTARPAPRPTPRSPWSTRPPVTGCRISTGPLRCDPKALLLRQPDRRRVVDTRWKAARHRRRRAVSDQSVRTHAGRRRLGAEWQPVDPDRPGRHAPRLPAAHGDAVVIARVPRPPDQRQSSQPSTVTSLFVRQGAPAGPYRRCGRRRRHGSPDPPLTAPSRAHRSRSLISPVAGAPSASP